MKRKQRSLFLNPKKGEIQSFDAGEVSEEWIKLFAANKNIYRTVPHVIDGLKPVRRRILYSVYTDKFHGKKPKKVSQIMGETMGRFHPHGDTSIGEAVVSMAEKFKNNILLMTADGAFGNICGDEAAAFRYIKSCLTEFSNMCYFKDFSKSNVPMSVPYTGDEDDLEPEYLPSRYPVILFNPQFSGIGYGLASNIPPFNPKEVMEATIRLIKDKKCEINLIPDSPTKCDIVDTGYFRKINKTGIGKVVMQSTYEIDYNNNRIKITSLPIYSKVNQVKKKIAELKKSGNLEEVVDIKDDSKKDNVDFTLFLKSDAKPDKVIDLLLKKKIGLKESYSCELRVVDDFETKVLSTKKILQLWIDYRRDCIYSIYNNIIIDLLTEHHMNQVLVMILEGKNAEKTITIAKTSKNAKEMQEKLLETYDITTLQAETISLMRITSFNTEKREEYKKKDEKLTKEIEKVEKILSNEKEIDRIIIHQLEEGIKLFGYPRQSNIISNETKVIPDVDYLVGISKDGFIKKINLEYISIGNVGKTSSVAVTVANNRDNLLLFASDGSILRVNLSVIPEMEQDGNGIEINRFMKMDSEVISIIPESEVKECVNSNVILITENGYGKKVSLSEFRKLDDRKISITLNEGDSLKCAIPSVDTDEFIIYTNFGDGIRLSSKELKQYGKAAKGLKLISLKVNEKVKGIDIIDGTKDKFVYITSSGRMKMTKEAYFPLMKRKDEPLSLISLENGEQLENVFSVDGTEKVCCFRKKNTPVEIKLSNVPLTTRIAKATKLVKTPKSDKIIGAKIIKQ